MSINGKVAILLPILKGGKTVDVGPNSHVYQYMTNINKSEYIWPLKQFVDFPRLQCGNALLLLACEY
jgi:hypothetical protein